MSDLALTSSVALCSYNGEKYIQEQLESLASQTRLPDELVVCDDCSTDRTAEIVEAFSKTAPFPVRLFRNPKNLGYNGNFQQAAMNCEGDVVFFCDQDDYWRPEKIAAFMEQFERREDVGMVFSEGSEGKKMLSSVAIKYFRLPANFPQLIKNDRVVPLLNTQCTWFGHMIAYRRSFNTYLFPMPKTEFLYDGWAFILMLVLAPAVYLDYPYTDHRYHVESFLGQASEKSKDKDFTQQLDSRANIRHILQSMSDIPQTILTRLDEIPVERKKPEAVAALRSRALHYANRARMRDGLILRYYLAMVEFLTGRYFRHSSGLLSFGKDLLKE